MRSRDAAPPSPSRRSPTFSGVYHQAQEFLYSVVRGAPKSERPEIEQYQWDAIETAALVHDIGHGPWSHMFDSVLLPKFLTKAQCEQYEHENRSIRLFDHLLETSSEETLHEAFDDKTKLRMVGDLINPKKDDLSMEARYNAGTEVRVLFSFFLLIAGRRSPRAALFCFLFPPFPVDVRDRRQPAERDRR